MKNRFIDDLLSKANDRFSIDSLSMPMSEWITKNTTLKGRPFSLKGYEFQREIVDDMHPNLNCIKISQVGLTETQIRKALGFLVRNNGTSAIFSLPNEDMYKRVSNTRVKPIVNFDKVFNTPYDKENKATRSMDTMQFGQSFLYLVPATESAATSIAADFVLNDEVDLSDQSMISLFNSRLQGSKFRISQKFSTPTFPAFGIDLEFKSSDQKHYMVRCECCRKWTHPEFSKDFINLPGVPDSIELVDVTEEMKDDLDFVNSYVRCDHCGKPLNLHDPSLREWVAKYPNRLDSRGYLINPFVNANLDIQYIYTSLWKFMKSENRRGFYNTVLGKAYSDGSIQLPEEKIKACMTNVVQPPDFKNYDTIAVGIDVGQICHITIGDGYGNVIAIYQKHVDQLVSHVEDLCKNFKVRVGAIDRHPYEPTADEVFRVSGGKIVPTEYRGHADINLKNDAYGEFAHAQVNRTYVLDLLATRIRKEDISISGYGHHKEVFISHLRNMVRDETPEKPAEWIKLNTEDHYFHSTALMNVSFEIADLVRLSKKEEVRTMALGMVANIKDQTPGMIGMTSGGGPGKKVDRIITRL